jgi:hypothetical protein
MKKKKRPGFVQHATELSEQTYRRLKWWKKKKGGSVNEFFVQQAERRAKEIVEEIGEPPADFS